MNLSAAFAFVATLCMALPCAAQAGPIAAGGVGKVAAPERPYTLQEATNMKKLSSFGLCDAVQNADDLPTQPVPVQEDTCNFYQRFEANSVGPSNGGSCGGYTVAFGPMGDLKLNWKRYRIDATWGDTPLTQAQCGQERLAAVAWGARCLNDACSDTQWEKIGTPRSKAGTWSTNQGRCVLSHQFSNGDKHYKTLSVDIIASLKEGAQTVRKRAHAVIRAERGNAKCANTTLEARPAPAQAASTAGATYQPRQKP